MKYPKALEDLIEDFSQLPSIGRKTAERLAFYVYNKMPEENVTAFGAHLTNVKSSIHKCKSCGNICENEYCDICMDNTRDHSVVMVVENIKDLYVMEHVNEYKGIYHVLNGAISFSKGIGIEDLEMESLISKVRNKEVKELILACNATLEGETTAKYIKALFQDDDVKITRIAHGLPVGGDLAYADEMTVLKALEGRRDY